MLINGFGYSLLQYLFSVGPPVEDRKGTFLTPGRYSGVKRIGMTIGNPRKLP